MQTVIRVMIAVDDRGSRALLRKALEPERDMAIIAEAENGERACELSSTHRPDVIVMDLEMPVLNGFGATQKILKALPQTRILFHSWRAEVTEIERAFAMGA